MRVRKTSALVTAVVLALGLAACGGDDSGSTPATEAPATEAPSTEAPDTEAPDTEAPAEIFDMNVAVSPAVTVLPQYVAMAEGFFEARGINATFVGVANGPELGAAMISGEITTSGNIPNNQIGLINAGFDVVAVHEIVSSQFFDILVGSNIDLGGETDWVAVMNALKGSNVGVVANGAAAEDIARSLFEEAGVDPDAQTYIATGLPDTTLAALSNGEIDIAITFDPAFVIAEAQGIGYQPFSLRDGEGPAAVLWPSLLATFSREYAEKNPAAIKGYSDAIADAVQFIQNPANRDRVLEIMIEDMQFNADLAAPMLDANVGYFNPTGEFNIEALNAAGQWVYDIGKSEKVLTAADFTVDAG